MPKRYAHSYTIYDAVTPVAVTSSTDATPIVVTATAHGFSTGDLVQIIGHTTNTAANGLYRVTRLTANTFSLQDKDSGDDIAGSGGGAGSSGIVYKAPKIALVDDYTHVEVSIHSAGTSTYTAKLVGSFGKSATSEDAPDFTQTVGPSNSYDFVQMIDLEDASAVDGDAGFAPSGSDDNRHFEANISGMRWLTVIFTAWTQGSLTCKIRLYSND